MILLSQHHTSFGRWVGKAERWEKETDDDLDQCSGEASHEELWGPEKRRTLETRLVQEDNSQELRGRD
jgi:hypothetical protein